VRAESDFLMAMSSPARQEGLDRKPDRFACLLVVSGGGLTAIDTATNRLHITR